MSREDKRARFRERRAAREVQKPHNVVSLLERIERCEFQCQAGPLSLSEDWTTLKTVAREMSMRLQRIEWAVNIGLREEDE